MIIIEFYYERNKNLLNFMHFFITIKCLYEEITQQMSGPK